MPQTTVAIIGAGSAGICAARACLSRGLSVTIFDKRSSFGGIWSGEDTPVFDNLTTNTGCFDTCLSDVPPLRSTPKGPVPEGDNLCLSAEEYREYLHHVVRVTPGMAEAFRGQTEVVAIREVQNGYDVEYSSLDEVENKTTDCERFDYVIIASGPHHNPAFPEIPGLDKFKGEIVHVEKYKNPDQFAGKRVLVVGGSVSGCEAAADMAEGIASERPTSITLSTRKMRFVAVKQKGNNLFVPDICNRFSHLRQLAGEMWSDEYKADLAGYLRGLTKHEDYDMPATNVPVHEPGFPNIVPVHERLLSASKKRLINWNIGGISEFKGDKTVVFKDSTESEFDAVVFASGYHMSFPFLDERTRQLVHAKEMPNYFLDLADHTLHPQLPRLAFIGLFAPGSAAVAVTDMQARYVARVIAKPETKPSEEELIAAQEAYRKQRTSEKAHAVVFGFELLDRCSQRAGFEVDLSVHKEWTKALLFGPLVPAQFRLFGEGKLDSALDDFEREMTGAGYVKGDNKVDTDILRKLVETCRVLAANGKMLKGLQEAVDHLCSVNNYGDTANGMI